jgi:hypothetical protein
MRYHFDIATPRGLARDEEGEEFTSDAEAIKGALYAARELASERVLLGDWAIVIRGEDAQVFQTLRLAEVVNGPERWFPAGPGPRSGGSPQH